MAVVVGGIGRVQVAPLRHAGILHVELIDAVLVRVAVSQFRLAPVDRITRVDRIRLPVVTGLVLVDTELLDALGLGALVLIRAIGRGGAGIPRDIDAPDIGIALLPLHAGDRVGAQPADALVVGAQVPIVAVDADVLARTGLARVVSAGLVVATVLGLGDADAVGAHDLVAGVRVGLGADRPVDARPPDESGRDVDDVGLRTGIGVSRDVRGLRAPVSARVGRVGQSVGILVGVSVDALIGIRTSVRRAVVGLIGIDRGLDVLVGIGITVVAPAVAVRMGATRRPLDRVRLVAVVVIVMDVVLVGMAVVVVVVSRRLRGRTYLGDITATDVRRSDHQSPRSDGRHHSHSNSSLSHRHLPPLPGSLWPMESRDDKRQIPLVKALLNKEKGVIQKSDTCK